MILVLLHIDCCGCISIIGDSYAILSMTLSVFVAIDMCMCVCVFAAVRMWIFEFYVRIVDMWPKENEIKKRKNNQKLFGAWRNFMWNFLKENNLKIKFESIMHINYKAAREFQLKIWNATFRYVTRFELRDPKESRYNSMFRIMTLDSFVIPLHYYGTLR